MAIFSPSADLVLTWKLTQGICVFRKSAMQAPPSKRVSIPPLPEETLAASRTLEQVETNPGNRKERHPTRREKIERDFGAQKLRRQNADAPDDGNIPEESKN